MSRPVPNQMPASDPGAVRLALVGEAPGADEVALGRPFSGQSGWKLDQWLASAGLSRAQVFVGNVCQVRPSASSNDFHLLDWNGEAVQAGIAALQSDLAAFRPHCVLALGNAALHLLRHGNGGPPKSAKRQLFQWSSHIGTWRGSLFLAASDFNAFTASELRFQERTRYENLPGAIAKPSTDAANGHGDIAGRTGSEILPTGTTSTGLASVLNARLEVAPQGLHHFKCLATYHPAATFRDPSFTYPLVSDLRRAVAEARSPLLTLPARRITWGHSLPELEARFAAMRAARTPVGFDIEGGLRGLQCCSFATTPNDAFVVDLMTLNGDAPETYRLLASVLEDASVPKVCWNAAYERAILQATASITMRGYEDGMLAWWERFSELPKGLDFVASLLTREPYWADGIGWDRKTGRPRVTGEPFWTYNGIDSCVTLEIWQHATIRAVVESRQPVPFETP